MHVPGIDMTWWEGGFFVLALVLHILIFKSSLRGAIRNQHVGALLLAWCAYSLTYASVFGFPSPEKIAVNAFFLLAVFFWTWKFSSPAYAKYALASGSFFLFSGSASHFATSAIVVSSLSYATAATFFYVRTVFAGWLFSFVRKHVADASKNKDAFSPATLVRHVLAFVTVVASVRMAQLAISTWFESHRFDLSSEEFSMILTLVGMGVSWVVFSMKDRVFSKRWKAVAAGAVFMAFVGFFVWELGYRSAVSLFFHASVMYAIVWAFRKSLHFYSLAEGTRFVPYNELRPGDQVEKRFLSRFLYDYRFDEFEREALLRDLNGGAKKEWIERLSSYVERATESALARGLPGFVPRTEVLVLRKITLVPQIAAASLACLAVLPHSPAEYLLR